MFLLDLQLISPSLPNPRLRTDLLLAIEGLLFLWPSIESGENTLDCAVLPQPAYFLSDAICGGSPSLTVCVATGCCCVARVLMLARSNSLLLETPSLYLGASGRPLCGCLHQFSTQFCCYYSTLCFLSSTAIAISSPYCYCCNHDLV